MCISVILILTAILSALFLSEKIGLFKLISLLICILGVILVVQPEILFPPSDVDIINIITEGANNTWGHGNNISTTTEGALNKMWQASDINSDSELGFPKKENRKNSSISNQNSSMDFTSPELLKNQHTFPASFKSNYTLYPQSTIHETLTISNTSSTPTYVGYLMAVLSGVGGPVLIVVAKGTSIQNEPQKIQVTWIYISGLAVSTVTMVVFEHFILPDTLTDWLLLSGHVIFSFLGTVIYYYAITLTSGVLVTLTYTTSVILSMLSQYLLTQGVMPGHHNVLEFLGSILVFIAATLNPIVQLVRERCKWADPDPSAV